MLAKDFKRKMVERFIEIFNNEHCKGLIVNTVTINNMPHFNTKKLELDGDLLVIRKRVRDFDITSCCIRINDINNMYYVNNSYITVSLDNIEF